MSDGIYGEVAPTPEIVENGILQIPEGLGLYARADSSDMQKWILREKLSHYNNVLQNFALHLGLKEFTPSNVYYHNRLRFPLLLEMSFAHMGTTPFNNELYLAMEAKKLGSVSPKIHVVRINNLSGKRNRKDLVVWESDDNGETFWGPKNIQGKVKNPVLYNHITNTTRNGLDGVIDPYLILAGSVYPHNYLNNIFNTF